MRYIIIVIMISFLPLFSAKSFDLSEPFSVTKMEWTQLYLDVVTSLLNNEYYGVKFHVDKNSITGDVVIKTRNGRPLGDEKFIRRVIGENLKILVGRYPWLRGIPVRLNVTLVSIEKEGKKLKEKENTL